MVTWSEFVADAPHIAEVFVRRHGAARNLCMLATIRADGSPRISPMEPRILDGRLVLVGMENTTKFRDLDRDPRFCLHTATIDPYVAEGDAKLFGRVRHDPDKDVHVRFADMLFEEIGLDLRGQELHPFYVADITGASTVELRDGQLTITVWRPGEAEQAVIKS